MRGAFKLTVAVFALVVMTASAQAGDKHHGGGHAGKSPADALGSMHSHGAGGAVGSHLGGAVESTKVLGLFGLNGRHGEEHSDGRGDRRDSGGGNGAAIGQAIGGFLGAVLGGGR